jgi:hypothetical protein
MNRRHALIVSVVVGLAVAFGALAAARTIRLGATPASTKTVSHEAIAKNERALSLFQHALERQRAQRPPKLPAVPRYPSVRIPSVPRLPARVAPQRRVAARPAPRKALHAAPVKASGAAPVAVAIPPAAAPAPAAQTPIPAPASQPGDDSPQPSSDDSPQPPEAQDNGGHAHGD